MDPLLHHIFHVLFCPNPAFTDPQTIRRNFRSQLLRRLQVDLKGMQIPVIDPDDIRLYFQGPIHLPQIMHLHQDIGLQRPTQFIQPLQLLIGQSRHNEQKSICP